MKRWQQRARDFPVKDLVMVTPRNHSLRCRLLETFWHCETRTAESVIGFLTVLRGLWMVNPRWQTIPLEVQGNVIPSFLTELQWGTWNFSLGLLMIGLAGRRSPRIRGYVATALAVTEGTALIGYWRSDLFFRGVVSFILAILLVSIWIAYRARKDFRDATQLEERRTIREPDGNV